MPKFTIDMKPSQFGDYYYENADEVDMEYLISSWEKKAKGRMRRQVKSGMDFLAYDRYKTFLDTSTAFFVPDDSDWIARGEEVIAYLNSQSTPGEVRKHSEGRLEGILYHLHEKGYAQNLNFEDLTQEQKTEFGRFFSTDNLAQFMDLYQGITGEVADLIIDIFDRNDVNVELLREINSKIGYYLTGHDAYGNTYLYDDLTKDLRGMR